MKRRNMAILGAGNIARQMAAAINGLQEQVCAYAVASRGGALPDLVMYCQTIVSMFFGDELTKVASLMQQEDCCRSPRSRPRSMVMSMRFWPVSMLWRRVHWNVRKCLIEKPWKSWNKWTVCAGSGVWLIPLRGDSKMVSHVKLQPSPLFKIPGND